MEMIKGSITRRMDASLNHLQEELKEMVCSRDFEKSLKELKHSSKSERHTRLRNLYLLMDKCQLKYELGQSDEYYERLIKQSESIPTPEKMEEQMLLALYNQYEDYLTPEEYMKRMVDRLCIKEDGWENDTLRLRILKQFIKYGKYLEDAGFRGRAAIKKYVGQKINRKVQEEDVLFFLDDGIFDVLKTANKAQKKPNGTYGLIKAADDLAFGKFRMGGATKKLLYLFAMVFFMSYYTGSKTENFNYNTDIETNLFRRYYHNNLMRFITDAYSGNLSEFEMDPSGIGINYKNFAEMVYLYYISKPLEPCEKIRLSAEMIGEIMERSRNIDAADKAKHDDTKSYVELFTEDILSLNEDDFKKFILLNYDCSTYLENHTIGPIQVQTGQKSAHMEYKQIISQLQKVLKKNNMSMEECNFGLWFIDAARLRKKGFDRLFANRTDINRCKLEKLIQLLIAVHDYIGYSPEMNKPKALMVSSKEEMTRTSLLVAYYYLYTLNHEIDDGMIGKSFEEVYKSFENEINPILERAFYQPINSGYIFDIVLIFSAYTFLNM